MAYEAKDDVVRERQLKVQQLCLDFSITGNATPAAVVVVVHDPAILMLKTQGTDRITPNLPDGEALPTYVAQNDASGAFSAFIQMNETLAFVDCAMIIRRNSPGIDFAYLANTNGIDASGMAICLNCQTSVNLSSANLEGSLIVRYAMVPGGQY